MRLENAYIYERVCVHIIENCRIYILFSNK